MVEVALTHNEGAEARLQARLAALGSSVDPDLVLLDENELGALVRESVSSLQKKRLAGGGIPFLKLGGRTVRYKLSAVKTYLECAGRRSTSQSEAA